MILKVRPLLLGVGSGIMSPVPFAVQILTLIPQKPCPGVISELLPRRRTANFLVDLLVRPPFRFRPVCFSRADGCHPPPVLIPKLDIVNEAFFLSSGSTINGEWPVHCKQPPSNS